MSGGLDYYRVSFLDAHSICMDKHKPPHPSLHTHSHTNTCFVNLIKAAFKQCFISLGPNLPCRRHVTPCAARTCCVRAFPRPPRTLLTQPISGTSTENMSAGHERKNMYWNSKRHLHWTFIQWFSFFFYYVNWLKTWLHKTCKNKGKTDTIGCRWTAHYPNRMQPNGKCYFITFLSAFYTKTSHEMSETESWTRLAPNRKV